MFVIWKQKNERDNTAKVSVFFEQKFINQDIALLKTFDKMKSMPPPHLKTLLPSHQNLTNRINQTLHNLNYAYTFRALYRKLRQWLLTFMRTRVLNVFCWKFRFFLLIQSTHSTHTPCIYQRKTFYFSPDDVICFLLCYVWVCLLYQMSEWIKYVKRVQFPWNLLVFSFSWLSSSSFPTSRYQQALA